MRIIGKCGACGGDVTIPTVWMGIFPPKPTCQSCGRHPVDKRKVIDMA